jgi:DNA (cytosine-5)-methyltransferase 1
MKHLGLFEGIGGFSLAARWMGWETLAWCEWNEFGQKVLKHHFPEAEGFGDIKKTDFTKYANRIDIITGGFPCQPYSSAGKRKGKEDERHLWPEMLRAIREVQPSYVVGENVRGLTNWNGGLVFDEVQADLEAEGYEVLPFLLPACAVNAPHRRDRIWFVAHNKINGREASEGINEWYEYKQNNRIEIRSTFDQNGKGRHATNTNNSRFKTFNNQKSKLGQTYRTKTFSGNSIKSFYSKKRWQSFPTKSPICGGDDGISNTSHINTIQKENTMDRTLVIKSAIDEGRLIADIETGKIYSTVTKLNKGERIELMGANCNGYRVHNISFGGVKKQCRAHQIVWIYANGIYDKKNLMIDHIDRNRSNNKLSNLRLVDAKGNMENKTPYEGKLTQEQKDEMYLLYTQGDHSMRELAEDYGMSKSRVHQLISEHSGMDNITFSKWRTESIKAYGNAIVPQIAYELFKAIEATDKTF